jgi:hypothetical protein
MASFLLAKSFFAEPKLKAEKTQKNVPHIHTSRRNPDAKPARSSHPNRLRFSATLERFCNDIFMTLSLQSEQPAFNLVTSLVTNWASPLNPAKALVGYFYEGLPEDIRDQLLRRLAVRDHQEVYGHPRAIGLVYQMVGRALTHEDPLRNGFQHSRR